MRLFVKDKNGKTKAISAGLAKLSTDHYVTATKQDNSLSLSASLLDQDTTNEYYILFQTLAIPYLTHLNEAYADNNGSLWVLGSGVAQVGAFGSKDPSTSVVTEDPANGILITDLGRSSITSADIMDIHSYLEMLRIWLDRMKDNMLETESSASTRMEESISEWVSNYSKAWPGDHVPDGVLTAFEFIHQFKAFILLWNYLVYAHTIDSDVGGHPADSAGIIAVSTYTSAKCTPTIRITVQMCIESEQTNLAAWGSDAVVESEGEEVTDTCTEFVIGRSFSTYKEGISAENSLDGEGHTEPTVVWKTVISLGKDEKGNQIAQERVNLKHYVELLPFIGTATTEWTKEEYYNSRTNSKKPSSTSTATNTIYVYTLIESLNNGTYTKVSDVKTETITRPWALSK